MNANVKKYYNTLKRIPADIRLRMATREFNMNYRHSCVCGWAIRESIASTLPNTDAAGVFPFFNISLPLSCATTFGGNVISWNEIFLGVVNGNYNDIELAFTYALEDALKHA